MAMVRTVDVAVTDDAGNVLLIERGKDPHRGKLVLPGGHVDPEDTSLAHAASRELEEEAGLVVHASILQPLCVLDATGRDTRGDYLSHVFAVTLPRVALRAAKAGSDAAAVTIRSLTSIDPNEMGFDHYAVIRALRERQEESV